MGRDNTLAMCHVPDQYSDGRVGGRSVNFSKGCYYQQPVLGSMGQVYRMNEYP